MQFTAARVQVKCRKIYKIMHGLKTKIKIHFYLMLALMQQVQFDSLKSLQWCRFPKVLLLPGSKMSILKVKPMLLIGTPTHWLNPASNMLPML
jgi:hypothetical protein